MLRGLSLVAMLLWSSVPGAARQLRAFWVDAYHHGYKTPAEADRMLEDVVSARANAVFVEARLAGGSYFLHSLEPPAEDAAWTPGFDVLEYLIAGAHARGIEVHAWFPVTPLWPYTRPPADVRHAWNLHGPNAPASEMWMTLTAGGRLSGSVDLGHPDALKYLADVILEPLRHYDLDGLHLDYIRYPEDADYGWNPRAVDRFARLYNRAGSPEPNDPRWGEFRRRQVTELVRQVYLRASAIKPRARISAALVAWGNGPLSDDDFRSSDAYRRVFQDWRSWLEEGIIDIGMPMNYFAEARSAATLDRWLEFEKNRQGKRVIVPGLGLYLNSIPDSIRQAQRVLAPSAQGSTAAGVAFYSYASTNLPDSSGAPAAPNAGFYKAAAALFGDPAAPPVLEWKNKPSTAHACGTLAVEAGPAWLKDGATVWLEPEGGGPAVRTATDGTGFFGAVDLAPGRYRARVERGGVEVFRSAAQDLKAGSTASFDILLTRSDFENALPHVSSVSVSFASPGDVATVSGARLAAVSAWAESVPLPPEMGSTQVVVNGAAAALLSVSPERIEFQFPYLNASRWVILVRHAGMESQPVLINSAQATPVITGTRRVEPNRLEIYATGLGMTDPPAQAGTGYEPGQLPRITLPVFVTLDQGTGRPLDLIPTFAGLAPYVPGRYQVNVELPPGTSSGTIRILVGNAESGPTTL